MNSLQAASHVLAHELLSRHWDCLGHHERHTHKTDFEFRQRTTCPGSTTGEQISKKKDEREQVKREITLGVTDKRRFSETTGTR